VSEKLTSSAGLTLNRRNQSGTFLVMLRSATVRTSQAPLARTIRFPGALRERIVSDAERCGRSFEGQVISLLRRHYGEDVDIAPHPTDILALAAASFADLSESDLAALTKRFMEKDR
jgi:hypothetical protein